jgi:hypothetical protein
LKKMSELDGEVKGCEVISKPANSFPYDAERYFDKDNFYPMDGEVIPMVAANAAQNTGNYFDQDNFYPADGVINPDAVNYEQEGSLTDTEFSNGIGDWFKETAENIKERGAERRAARKARKEAKTQEILSRAELNKSLTQDKPSDIALADALKSATATPAATRGGATNKGMSKTTKTVLIVGGSLVVVGLIAFFVLRKKK